MSVNSTKLSALEHPSVSLNVYRKETWAEVQLFAEKYQLDTVVANRAVNIFNDRDMAHFRNIVQRRKKQLKMDRFLLKAKRKATAEIDSPEQKKQRREQSPEGQLPTAFTEGDSPSKQ